MARLEDCFASSSESLAAPQKQRRISREVLGGDLVRVDDGWVHIFLVGTHSHAIPMTAHVPEHTRRRSLGVVQGLRSAMAPPAPNEVRATPRPRVPTTDAEIVRQVQHNQPAPSRINSRRAAARLVASVPKPQLNVGLLQSWRSARAEEFVILHRLTAFGRLADSSEAQDAGVGVSLIKLELLDRFLQPHQPKVLCVDTTHNYVSVGQSSMYATTVVFSDVATARSCLLFVALHASIDMDDYNMAFTYLLRHFAKRSADVREIVWMSDMSNALRDGLAVARANAIGLLQRKMTDRHAESAVVDAFAAGDCTLLRDQASLVWIEILDDLARCMRVCVSFILCAP